MLRKSVFPNPQQTMPQTPLFLFHLRPQCTGDWQLHRFSSLTLWQCSQCGSAFPDAAWVREAAARETCSGHQIQQLAQEGQRLLGDAGR